MSDKKPSISLTNKPSQSRRHDSGEWVGHLHRRELTETRRDIVDARMRLGKLSTRFVIEAMCAGEDDEQELIGRMLGLVDGDALVEDLEIDMRELKKLATTVGGERAKKVVENSVLREIDEKPTKSVPVSDKTVQDQQTELLRALLKTMDPEVVKRALTGG